MSFASASSQREGERSDHAHPLIAQTLIHRLRDERHGPREDLAHERLRRDSRSAVIAVRADSVFRYDHEDDVGREAEEDEREDRNNPWDRGLRCPGEPEEADGEEDGQADSPQEERLWRCRAALAFTFRSSIKSFLQRKEKKSNAEPDEYGDEGQTLLAGRESV